MKTIQYFLILALAGVFFHGKAQNCAPASPLGAQEGRSVMGLIVGSYPRLGPKGMEQAVAEWKKKAPSWERAYAVSLLERHLSENMAVVDYPLTDSAGPYADLLGDSASMAAAHYYEGLLQVVDGKYGLGVRSFNASELSGSINGDCRLPYFKTIAQYLEKYGTDSPLFKGFNGGFYNFTCDSLQWRFQQPDSADFTQMLLSLMDLSAMSGQEPVYHELMGDLLIHHPDRITANWFAFLAYFRLSHELPASAESFDEKAIYALEAPKTKRRTFDMYRFNQLRDRLGEDLDSADALRARYEAGEAAAVAANESARAFLEAEVAKLDGGEVAGKRITWMHELEPGLLPGIVREADKRYAENYGKEAKFAGEVDLKSVKSETQFNVYGISMILVVIGAVAFLWWQLRRNRDKSA